MRITFPFILLAAASGAPINLAATAPPEAKPPSACGIDARMLRFPDVSATQIAFVYAGDIWVASKAGGEAMRRLTGINRSRNEVATQTRLFSSTANLPRSALRAPP